MQATAMDLVASDLLAGLPSEALERLAERARMHELQAGQALFDEGDPGTSLFIVLHGEIQIRKGLGPDDAILATVSAGEHFGELAVFDPAPRSAAAMASAPSRLVEVDRDSLEEVLRTRPSAAIRMVGTIARSLTDAKEQLTLFNQFLDKKVRERTVEVRETQLEVIRRLGRAAEYRDEDTGAHIYRMSHYAGALAKAAGFTGDDHETLMYAAPMHDVGKIGVPDRILLKPAKLDDDEWQVMKAHTIMGASMLTGSRSAIIRLAQTIALTHHERWDGSGYPNNLAGEGIPLEARVCCLADVFDALTSERPYKKAWTFDDALEEISSQGGKMFDPELTPLFLSLRPELQEISDKSRAIGEAVSDVATTIAELDAQMVTEDG